MSLEPGVLTKVYKYANFITTHTHARTHARTHGDLCSFCFCAVVGA